LWCVWCVWVCDMGCEGSVWQGLLFSVNMDWRRRVPLHHTQGLQSPIAGGSLRECLRVGPCVRVPTHLFPPHTHATHAHTPTQQPTNPKRQGQPLNLSAKKRRAPRPPPC